MGDLYVLKLSDDDEERGRHEEERERKRAEVRARYAERLVRRAAVDEVTADLVLAALFDNNDGDGKPCSCSCHPRLVDGDLHDSGFDCICTWSEDRRDAEHREWLASLEEFESSYEGQELARARDEEHAELTAWIESHPGVSAEQTSWAAPEQWVGTVDGRSFYFRERHGQWHIELDLEPTGRSAARLVDTGPDGEMLTEPVETTQGEVIAEGVASALGDTAIAHLEFIVRTIREYITGECCQHLGAINFCPTCGTRV
jgi:hypothetical protein